VLCTNDVNEIKGGSSGRYCIKNLKLKNNLMKTFKVLEKGLFTKKFRVGGRVKKFEVCMGEEKTKENKRCKTPRRGGGRGSDLSRQMLQDVLCEQPLSRVSDV
jgi:hypothetical protein